MTESKTICTVSEEEAWPLKIRQALHSYLSAHPVAENTSDCGDLFLPPSHPCSGTQSLSEAQALRNLSNLERQGPEIRWDLWQHLQFLMFGRTDARDFMPYLFGEQFELPEGGVRELEPQRFFYSWGLDCSLSMDSIFSYIEVVKKEYGIDLPMGWGIRQAYVQRTVLWHNVLMVHCLLIQEATGHSLPFSLFEDGAGNQFSTEWKEAERIFEDLAQKKAAPEQH